MINVPNYLDILANAGVPIERFESGQTIFVDGSSGDKMYVVYSGKVAIEREGNFSRNCPRAIVLGKCR